MATRYRLLGELPALPHESIFGWILRLADDHQVTVEDVLRAARLYDVRADVDFGLNATGWSELAAFAGLPADSFIHARALRAGLARKPSVAPLVLRRTSDGKPCYAFCAQCMRHNGDLYLPIEWRINQYRVCPRHSAWLSTRCPHCSAHLTLEQLIAVRRTVTKRRRSLLGRCPTCAKPLGPRSTRRPTSAVRHVWVERQQAVLASVVHGYCRFDGVARKFSVNTALAIDDWAHLLWDAVDYPAESLLARLEHFTPSGEEATFLRRLFQIIRPGYGYECADYILERRWATQAQVDELPPRVRDGLEKMATGVS